MNSKLARKSQKRIDTSYLSALRIQRYGWNNLYPQDVDKIVRNSATGVACLDRYAKFIKGNGFYNEILSEKIVNRDGATLDDLQNDLSADLARFGGFAIHVNYNILGEIVELQHVPFESARLEEPDENGFVNHVVLHPDWTGSSTRNGKKMTVDAAHVDRIATFNPDQSVVLAEIEEAGGISNYKGQVLYVSNAGRNRYPLAKYDGVLAEMVTDEGISDLKNRDVLNGFFPAGVFVVKKGQALDFGNEDSDENQDDNGDNELVKNFQDLQGAANAQRAMVYFIGPDDEVPQFVRIQGANYDKTFESTEKSTTERIYAAFGQEAFYRIRSGSLGFSSDIIQDVYSLYASMVVDEQRLIQRAFEVISNCYIDGNLFLADFQIQPMVYVNTNNQNSAL